MSRGMIVRWGTWLGWLLLAIVGNCGWGSSTVGAAERPNIIFVMADDLGYGDLGSYGQQKIATPHLDRMAQEGMRFTQFYAGSTVCAPSRCVLMTGRHTGHCWIRGNGKENLRPGDVTLAEVLQSVGYRTGLVGKWGIGHEGSTGVPTRQGFDEFFGYLDQHHAHNYYPRFLMRNEQRVPLPNVVPGDGDWGVGVASEKRSYSHDLLAEEALSFVRRHAEQPFFLYLALTIPHANNEAKEEGMEVPDLGRYADRDWPAPQKAHAAMISRMDQDVGRLLQLVRELDLDDRTIVFFTSDNGPHREGGNDPAFADSNGPLRGIKRSLHDGGIRVPLIVRWPNRVAAGSISDWVGSFQDVLPTAAAIASASVPSELDGISFLPTLLGQSGQAEHASLYWAFYEGGGGRALRAGNWKVVQQPYRSNPRLYNLQEDLGEEQDLAAQQPELVQRLVRMMDQADEPSARWQFPN